MSNAITQETTIKEVDAMLLALGPECDVRVYRTRRGSWGAQVTTVDGRSFWAYSALLASALGLALADLSRSKGKP
jgi:hypothetical protein